ncbi:protein-glutamate O-methyltransferase CheR [Isoptericola sp. b441]|uniref:protein-glutamate O-methyltransferase n=1 Tax=Actinotalea lenta TaxID=3064654 RepID=A0ABT9D5N2_9CELL|nr:MULTISPECIES: protein-glutamate O-methyltransferase CheR [unclassified Isoptericola]MDO8106096.1 protein-glutamate O-methyltransferase CheR [Isoptericola sp. b441]MDO8122185.1 protein-glutamate O-methyltransferase CheR [Isoptericola sp. b490]
MTLAPDTFAWVADLVRRRSAIQLEAGKEYLVESRLMPLARATGSMDVDAYVRGVRQVASPASLEAVVEALTTNETSWFRDAQPFTTLSRHIVPELLAQRPGAVLKIWSAACSSGQEPYSIAMTLEDLVTTRRVQILGTDLNQKMVDRARAGRYNQLEVNRGVPAPMLVKHFTRQGADWEVAAALRAATTFARHNLLEAPPGGGPFDVVFLRNVLIYFDLATKRDVLRRVSQAIRPGGYLLLGAAETTIGIDDGWERVSHERGSVYRLAARRAA